MFEPIKIGFGGLLGQFYGNILPTTKPLIEYIARGQQYAMAFASSTMVDEATKMLEAWQRNDTYNGSTTPAKLPVILVAIDRDYTPTPREFARQMSDSIEMAIPGDSLTRVFGLRTVAADIKMQIVIVANDEPTAHSLSAQFNLFLDATLNRRFGVPWAFAGITHNWPCQIETPQIDFLNVKTDMQNICIIAGNVLLRTTIPLFDAPAAGQPNDGQGVAGSSTNPAGYPVVVQYTDTKVF